MVLDIYMIKINKFIKIKLNDVYYEFNVFKIFKIFKIFLFINNT